MARSDLRSVSKKSKETSAKAKERRDKAMAKEKRQKAAEKKSKEMTTKERTSKERTNKERSKKAERSKKEKAAKAKEKSGKEKSGKEKKAKKEKQAKEIANKPKNPKTGKVCNSKAGAICFGYNLKCFKTTTLSACKQACSRDKRCNLAEYKASSRDCCLSAIATKGKCPGRWAKSHGWIGYNVCPDTAHHERVSKEQTNKAKERSGKERSNKAKERSGKERSGKAERSNKHRVNVERSQKNRIRATSHRWLGHINGWDAHMNWHTNGRTYVSGLKSWHNNGREDRLFNPLVTDIGSSQYGRVLSGWVNNWDAYFAYTCPTNKAIVGMYSYHDNRKEDRRWRFYCAGFHGVGFRAGGWPNWQTNWDAYFALSCGHNPVIGFSSYHDNRKEDRRWRIRCGSRYVRM